MLFDDVAPYGFGTTVALPFDEALAQTRAALVAEGFGILAEIDVAATLRQKLGGDHAPYVILGACMAPLAGRAIAAEPNVGLLLPCNVIVRTGDAPGESVVAALDPVAALALTRNPALEPLARDVSARLHRALARITPLAAQPSAPEEVLEEIC
jgi:uncharacterized protein (DUF302 family)